MAVDDAYVFLTPVLTLLLFPKPPTTFLTCFCRGERRKYDGKKSRLNRGSNSQPPGHESDTLTTEPPGRDKTVGGVLGAKLPIFCTQIDRRWDGQSNRQVDSSNSPKTPVLLGYHDVALKSA